MNARSYLRRVVPAVAAVLGAGACVVGAPLGFSDGDNWSIPVVGGLEDGQLIAPVTINGKGPYLFFVNPHSKSIVDPRIARDTDMYTVRTERGITDSTDTVVQEKIDYAEAKRIVLGNLTVSRRVFMVLPINASYHGRPVVGTIGNDFIDDTLIWTIDRDREMLYLSTQGHDSPADGAIKVEAARVRDGRFWLNARIDDKKAYVYMDLGMSTSAVWPEIAAKAGLESMAGREATDFFDRRYRYEGGFNAASVSIGDATARNVVFAPFQDARVRKVELDGYLGRDFFARFHVMVNWHKQTLWLEPRTSDLNRYLRDRLNRWGDRFAGCKTPACIETSIEASTAGAPPVIRVERDAGLVDVDLEVMLEAVDGAGTPVGLSRLLVAFPPGSRFVTFAGEEADRYAGAAAFRVVDATPFPPECERQAPDQGCVWKLQ